MHPTLVSSDNMNMSEWEHDAIQQGGGDNSTDEDYQYEQDPQVKMEYNMDFTSPRIPYHYQYPPQHPPPHRHTSPPSYMPYNTPPNMDRHLPVEPPPPVFARPIRYEPRRSAYAQAARQGGRNDSREEDRKPAAKLQHQNRHSISTNPLNVREAPATSDMDEFTLDENMSFDADEEATQFGITDWNMPDRAFSRMPAPAPQPAARLPRATQQPSPPPPPQAPSPTRSHRYRLGHAPPLMEEQHPTKAELDNAQTPRAKGALETWYQRFNELMAYKSQHGDCNVPQKYQHNKQLGVVSHTKTRTDNLSRSHCLE